MTTRTSTRTRSPFVVGPVYDGLLLLAPPTLAFLVGILLATSGASERHLVFGGVERRAVGLALAILIHAHLVAVFARSHLHPGIFRRHPIRFVVVPLVLYVALLVSPHLAAASIVVATFWDVYHSGAQTFGLARIYQRNAGIPDDPVRRRLDAVAQQFLYAGPIAAGVSLAAHLAAFREFDEFDDPFSLWLARIPDSVEVHAARLSLVVLGLAAVFFVGYAAYGLVRRSRGARGSRLATLLVASTGLCSVVTWGFDRWGEAFFVMNTFHAVQYLALVHATEGPRLRARFGLGDSPLGRGLFVAAFLGSTVAYGVLVEWVDPSIEAFWSLTMVVSLMHFWYDGFVWSVRAGDV